MVGHILTRRLAVVVLVAALAVLGLSTNTFSALAGTIRQTMEPSIINSHLQATTINREVVQNGIRVRLSSVEFASDATTLHLELGLVSGQVSPNSFLPIRPTHLQVSGIGGDAKTFGSVAQHPVTNGFVPVDVVVGPVIDRAAGANVTITEIDVLSADGSHQPIPRSWSFTLTPKQIVTDPTNITIPVQKTAQHDGISVAVTQVHLSSRAVSVRFTITGMTDGRVMPASAPLHLTLPDGRTFAGTMQHGTGASLRDGVALFPALPQGVTSFTLGFGPFLVVDPSPAEVTFPVPTGLREAPEGTTVALAQPFVLGGEQMQIVSISQKSGVLDIQVKNTEPGNQGRVIFVGPDTSGTALHDDLGNSYQWIGGSTGLQRDAQGTLSAGTGTLRFQGPLAAGVATVTVYANHFGRMVTGPDPITVAVPGH